MSKLMLVSAKSGTVVFHNDKKRSFQFSIKDFPRGESFLPVNFLGVSFSAFGNNQVQIVAPGFSAVMDMSTYQSLHSAIVNETAQGYLQGFKLKIDDCKNC